VDALEGCFVHSDVEQTGSFTCSEPLFNEIHRNVRWGLLSNLMSIPTDCPQRDERHGWLGDAHLAAEAAIYNFDMAAFYLKFLDDIRLAQREDGSLPDFVPPYVPRTYPADPAWGAAYAVLVWSVYWYYGDTRVIQRHYGPLKKYVDFLTKSAESHLIKGLGKYGDWCPPGSIVPKKTPVELTSTWYYYHDVLILSRLAQTIGRVEDVKAYGRLAEEIKSAFNAAYLEDDQYAALRVSRVDRYPNQTSNVLPLYLDLVPEPNKKAVLGKLLDSITRQADGHVDTGILGTRYLLDVLTENGHPEAAYRAVAHTSYPGWGYMIKEGATTLWERWEYLAGSGMNSHNHAMLGSVDAWFYRAVAGLSPLEPGWEKIRVAPRLVRELTSAEAILRTPRGMARSAWSRDDRAFHLEVLVPVGAKASIHLPLLWPKVKASEGGRVMWDKGEVKDSVQGVTYIGPEDDGLAIRVESGSYVFVLTAAD
jgi:alpha-L-rhamnosidase